jgi:outer membrane protein OmpA-like peptidoglycan-associated protein
MDKVYFPQNNVKLTEDAKKELENVYEVMKANPSLKVKIVGHADGIGSESYNKHVAKRRAESVRQFLISKGISKKRMTAVGMGKEAPVAPNDSPDGRAKNRRVDIIQVK